jgi:hypothetical protein
MQTRCACCRTSPYAHGIVARPTCSTGSTSSTGLTSSTRLEQQYRDGPTAQRCSQPCSAGQRGTVPPAAAGVTTAQARSNSCRHAYGHAASETAVQGSQAGVGTCRALRETTNSRVANACRRLGGLRQARCPIVLLLLAARNSAQQACVHHTAVTAAAAAAAAAAVAAGSLKYPRAWWHHTASPAAGARLGGAAASPQRPDTAQRPGHEARACVLISAFGR